MRLLIGFSGKIGSGKTTLAIEFARTIGAKFFSFGDLIRSIADEKGLDSGDRRVLQEIGEQQINLGWTVFCKKLLDSYKYNNEDIIVVDGIRHYEGLDTFKELIPLVKTYLVYIDITDTLSLERQKLRNNEIVFSYNKPLHMTEIQVKDILPSLADIIIDGNKDPEVLITQLCSWFIDIKSLRKTR